MKRKRRKEEKKRRKTEYGRQEMKGRGMETRGGEVRGEERKNHREVSLHAYPSNNFSFNLFIVVLIQFACLHITKAYFPKMTALIIHTYSRFI